MLTLLILFLIPRNLPPVDTVDQIEINHYHGTDGEEVFLQVIFWEHAGPSRFVRDWRLIRSTAQWPRRDPRTGLYTLRWFDEGSYREVRSWSRIETWTDYDPEMMNRTILPQELRRKLEKIK